jgi:hypothetical protein
MHHLRYIASISNMVHDYPMRTTVTLDAGIHEFAAIYATANGITLSAAIGELIRKAQASPPSAPPDIRRSASGLPMFPPTGRSITSELVKKLEEEEFDPEKFA